jgi:hypothetical protein
MLVWQLYKLFRQSIFGLLPYYGAKGGGGLARVAVLGCRPPWLSVAENALPTYSTLKSTNCCTHVPIII